MHPDGQHVAQQVQSLLVLYRSTLFRWLIVVWGYDMRDGVLTRVEGEERVEETLLTVPGNYPAYYAAIRDALNGDGENPVPASQAIQVMELIELGIESAKHRATLCLA